VKRNQLTSDPDGLPQEETLELLNPDVEYRTYGNSLYEITNQTHMLTVSDSAIEGHFSTSTLEGKSYEIARDYVENLRARYPVEMVSDGNEKRYELAPQAERNLRHNRRRNQSLIETNSRRRASGTVGNPSAPSQEDVEAKPLAMKAFAKGPQPDSKTIQPQWNSEGPNHHEMLLRDSLIGIDDIDPENFPTQKAAAPDDFNSEINELAGIEQEGFNVDLPNKIDQNKVANFIQDLVRTAFQAGTKLYYKHLLQMYVPARIPVPFNVPVIDDPGHIAGLGLAPWACESFYKASETSFFEEKKLAAFASHYLQDMAVPLHTGAILQQLGFVWDFDIAIGNRGTNPDIDIDGDLDIEFSNRQAHFNFEQAIANNWDSSNNDFKEAWRGGPSSASFIPALSTQNVAGISSTYADHIFDVAMENGASDSYWDSRIFDRSDIHSQIENCLNVAGTKCRDLLVSLGYGSPNDSGSICRTVCLKTEY